MPEHSAEFELRKFVAPEFVFGVGARSLVGQYARNLHARKALLVTDSGVESAGWLTEICQALESEGTAFEVYKDITPNPKVEEVMAGVEAYHSTDCNLLIALGGGSVMDCAKGIGIVASNGKPILYYEGIDQIDVPMPPLICIPTTGGTSADVSQFCIISNPEGRVKIAIISKAVVPDVSLIDPECLTTMDAHLTACTGMDALVHGVEAFVSNASSAITDLHALEGIRLITENLLECVQNPNDLELRSRIMRGSLETGLAFSNASLGGVHAMAHSLGGFKDLPHGECNSMLLRHVVEFNYPSLPEKYQTIGEIMGLELKGMKAVEKKTRILNKIDELRTEVGICATLSSHGISGSDVSPLSDKAIKDACIVTNPRTASKRDLEVIYEEAL